MKVYTRARIRVTVEVVCGTYSDANTLGQMADQAKREGVAQLERIFSQSPNEGRCTVVGDPEFLTIFAAEEK